MFIRLSKSKTSDLIKVYLVEGYRDENGKVKQRIIKSYGNLHELEAKDPNILEKLRAEAKNMPSSSTAVSINFDLSSSNDSRETDKNYGYFFIEALYRQLELPQFLSKFEPKTYKNGLLDEVLRLLVFSRILNPASKKATVEKQKEYFDPFNVSLDTVYKLLSTLCNVKEEIQTHLHQKVSLKLGRDTSLVFYDVTNYYFESEIENDLKKKGVSKDKKKTPLVQMALAIDSRGLPVAYRLFSGNTHDSITMLPTLENMKTSYKIDRIIITADKALNSGKNLAQIIQAGDGYIVSQKVRGASASFIKAVLEEDGYSYNQSKTFKIKSFFRERNTLNQKGEKVILKEKVVCFWSKNYDDREKYKREKLEEKIQEYLNNPSKYKASNRYGIKKYLKEVDVEIETGEVLDKETYLSFEKEKYDQDVALDGYYALVSSEHDMPNEEIIARYRELWKIEESFKVLKSDLEGRPVFVRNEDRIEGHFLVCFIALLFSRLLENMLNRKYSVRKIQESLKNSTCRKLSKGFYSLNKQDETFRAIEKAFGVNLNYSEMKVEQLKNTRKAIFHNMKN